MITAQKYLAPIIAVIGLIVLLCLPAGVYAQTDDSLFEDAKQNACNGANLSASGAQCTKANGSDKVDSAVAFAVNILTIVVGVAAVIMIIINGLRFITSNGDANSISAARNGIIYVIVGLIIVALAQIIVRFVLHKTQTS